MLRQTLVRSLFGQTIPLLLIGRALAKLEKAPVGLVNHSFYNETGGIAPKWRKPIRLACPKDYKLCFIQ